jgi:hypothetical protein
MEPHLSGFNSISWLHRHTSIAIHSRSAKSFCCVKSNSLHRASNNSISHHTTKVENKMVPVRIMKAYRRSRHITPLFRNLGTRWRSWLTSRPGRFSPLKKSQYPLNWRLGEAQSRSGSFGVEKSLFHLAGFETPDRPAPILATITTTSFSLTSTCRPPY